MKLGLWVGISAGLIGSACGGGMSPGDAQDGGGGGDPRTVVAEVPVTPKRDLDLLFVIDDSPSMFTKQLNLSLSFPSFLDVLASGPGGLPNLHLGVVSTDMGTKGSELVQPGPTIGQVGNGGCGGLGKAGALQTGTEPTLQGRFLRDIGLPGGSRERNYTGDLASTVGRMVTLGAGGCGFEQPLAAMRAALDDNPANAGFLRPDALLGVVFLADEDDCTFKTPALIGPESATLGPQQSFRCTRFGVTCDEGGRTSDEMNRANVKAQCGPSESSPLMDGVAKYRDFLRALKPSASDVFVAGVLGTSEPFAVELRTPPGGGTPQPALAHSCSYQGPSSLEVAEPAVRLSALLDGFPDRSTRSTICQPDLSDAMRQLGELALRASGSPCILRELADADPRTVGVQPDCVVEDLAGAAVTRLEPCGATPQGTCWRLVQDPVACAAAPGNLKLDVQRASAPDPSTVTRVRCLVE